MYSHRPVNGPASQSVRNPPEYYLIFFACAGVVLAADLLTPLGLSIWEAAGA